MTAGGYRPLVTVHLVWHPDCAEGEVLGREVFSALFEDPGDLTTHGMRIPVRLWSGSGAGEGAVPPPLPDLEAAERSIVVVLVDAHFVVTAGWPQYLAAVGEGFPDGPHRLLPVALSPSGLWLESAASEVNWIRPPAGTVQARVRFVLNRIAHALFQDLEQHPLTVFLSHAKRDGEALASQAREFLHGSTGVRDWFDAQDLLPGSRWEQQIRGAASSNLLLVVRSQAYATREWCRIEALQAKLAGSPVVVLDALELEEARSFPYLGNGPVLRWTPGEPDADWERLLSVILLEALRFSYFPRRVRQLCRLYGHPEPDAVVARPPELLTVLGSGDATLAGARTVVYPDPPLGAEELDLVVRMAPNLVPLTPTQLLVGV